VSKRWLVATGLIACAIGLIVFATRLPQAEPESEPEPESETVSESESDPETETDHAAEPERGSPLIADRIAELTALAERQDVGALPWLLRSQLAEQPELAPALILTAARLAMVAPALARDDAARGLGAWLDAESARHGRDARGNVAVLVEALATIDSPEAVDALVRALETQRLPLHVETLAVQGLFKLGDPRALVAVQRWNERVAALPAADGLQEALRKEAELAAQATLASLGS
jgi:hypothetical protein